MNWSDYTRGCQNSVEKSIRPTASLKPGACFDRPNQQICLQGDTGINTGCSRVVKSWSREAGHTGWRVGICGSLRVFLWYFIKEASTQAQVHSASIPYIKQSLWYHIWQLSGHFPCANLPTVPIGAQIALRLVCAGGNVLKSFSSLLVIKSLPT